jgi:magnesium transporter
VSHPADVVEALRSVPANEWPRLLSLIPDEQERAEVVAKLDEAERDAVLDKLSNEEIANLVENMESDDAADLIGELDPFEQRQTLANLTDEDREQVEHLLTYPEDSAGGIMQLERVDATSETTVAQTVARVRKLVEQGTTIHRIYVVDDQGRLEGSADLVDLVLNSDETLLRDIMVPPVATVTPLVDQEVVAQLFRKYDLVSLPVVSESGMLLGRILVDDIVDVLAEEAEEDAFLAAGTAKEELLYRDQAIRISMVRLPWIGINLVGSLLSAALLHLYEPVIEQAVIIAAFIPVITAMGGNVGTQSATIFTRGLALGRIDENDLWRIVFRELRVGLFMGLLCGVGVGIIAATLFGGGRVYLGVVVFIAMISAMSVAAMVGAIAPATMKAYGIDPAIASGPLVTTTNDIIGILIYLSTALIFLDHLR